MAELKPSFHLELARNKIIKLISYTESLSASMMSVLTRLKCYDCRPTRPTRASPVMTSDCIQFFVKNQSDGN